MDQKTNKQQVQNQEQEGQLQSDIQLQRLNNKQKEGGTIMYSISNYFSKVFGHDDDQINVNQTVNREYNLDNHFTISIKSQNKFIQLNKDHSQAIPICISVNTQENQNIQRNIGIDLICVVDVSGSMKGEKQLDIRDALLCLLFYLSEKDRLCLISFNLYGHKVTPLKRMNQSNKKYFWNVINGLTFRGGKNIAAGTTLAFHELRLRKYINQVSAIFLLTDGKDKEAINLVKAQHNKCSSVYSLFTFGFGNDCDAQLLSELCSLGKGAFYYVKDASLLDTFYANALGGLVSVVGEKLEIDVICKPQLPYDSLKISKTYGNMWTVEQVERQYKICIPQVISGSQKDYVFELYVPKFDQNINDSRYANIIEVKAKLNGINNGQQIIRSCCLPFSFLNEYEQIPKDIEDIHVQVQYMRVKAIEIIDEARKACENKEFELAQNMLKAFKQQIESNQELTQVVQMIYQDINSALTGCQVETFNSFGQTLMIQLKLLKEQQTDLQCCLNGTRKIYILEAKEYKKRI